MVVVLLLALTVSGQTQSKTTFTWDYNSALLCSSTVTKGCVATFQLLYQDAAGAWNLASTVSYSACAPPPAGTTMTTCTAAIPPSPNAPFGQVNWVVLAVSDSNVPSAYSNQMTIPKVPPAPVDLGAK